MASKRTEYHTEICHICKKSYFTNEVGRRCKKCKQALKNATKKEEVKSLRLQLMKENAPAPRKVMSEAMAAKLDREQLAINKAVDDKYKPDDNYRHPLPGSPEFEIMAAQCRHIDRIRKTQRIITPSEEYDLAFYRRGRGESVNELVAK